MGNFAKQEAIIKEINRKGKSALGNLVWCAWCNFAAIDNNECTLSEAEVKQIDRCTCVPAYNKFQKDMRGE